MIAFRASPRLDGTSHGGDDWGVASFRLDVAGSGGDDCGHGFASPGRRQRREREFWLRARRLDLLDRCRGCSAWRRHASIAIEMA